MRCLSIAAAIVSLLVFVSTVPALASSEEIRIGATVSASGKFASEVGPFQRLFTAWADQVNGAGGLHLADSGKRLPLRIIAYDDRSDAATARRLYERLIAVDKVHLLFGPYSSPLTFAASIPAERHHVPFIAICANSPKIYQRGFRWLVCIIDAAPRYTYRYWEMIEAEGQAERVGFVVENTLHPVGVYQGSRRLAEKAGLRISSADIIPPDAKDFTGVILRLKKTKPDIVYVAANIPFAVNFMQQAGELALSPKEFHCIHHSGIFRRPLGKTAEYVVGQSYWAPGMKLGDPGRFLALLKKSGIDLEDYPWAPAYMMAFEVAEEAWRRAGTLKGERVMQALKGLEMMTLGGKVRFAANGVGSINAYPSQIQRGRYEIVWPPEVATAAHVYPRPQWNPAQ